MKKTPLSKQTRELMRKIQSEDAVSLLSRLLGELMGPNFGELSSHYGLSIEDTIRFKAVATRLRESREKRGMDLKATAKALHIPQYRQTGSLVPCSWMSLRASRYPRT